MSLSLSIPVSLYIYMYIVVHVEPTKRVITMCYVLLTISIIYYRLLQHTSRARSFFESGVVPAWLLPVVCESAQRYFYVFSDEVRCHKIASLSGFGVMRMRARWPANCECELALLTRVLLTCSSYRKSETDCTRPKQTNKPHTIHSRV